MRIAQLKPSVVIYGSWFCDTLGSRIKRTSLSGIDCISWLLDLGGLETTTSTTSNERQCRACTEYIPSHVIAPRGINRRLLLSIPSRGRPKSSEVRVLTSTNTSSSRRSSWQTMSTSPPCGDAPRAREFVSFPSQVADGQVPAGSPRRQLARGWCWTQFRPHPLGDGAVVDIKSRRVTGGRLGIPCGQCHDIRNWLLLQEHGVSPRGFYGPVARRLIGLGVSGASSRHTGSGPIGSRAIRANGRE